MRERLRDGVCGLNKRSAASSRLRVVISWAKGREGSRGKEGRAWPRRMRPSVVCEKRVAADANRQKPRCGFRAWGKEIIFHLSKDAYVGNKKDLIARIATGHTERVRADRKVGDNFFFVWTPKMVPRWDDSLSVSSPFFDTDKSSLLKKHRASCCELIYECLIH